MVVWSWPPSSRLIAPYHPSLLSFHTDAHRTNFVLGAEPCDFKSEAADAFAAPAEERKVGEKLPPGACVDDCISV